MTDPRQLLDAYGEEEHSDFYGYDTFQLDGCAPKAFAALRAVLDRHYQLTPGGFSSPCAGCGHAWPCPTVQAIVTALEAK